MNFSNFSEKLKVKSVSIAYKFIFGILVCLAILFTITIKVSLSSQKNAFSEFLSEVNTSLADMKNKQIEEFGKLEQVKVASLSTLIMQITPAVIAAGDLSTLVVYVDTVVKDPSILYASIMDKDKNTLAEAGDIKGIAEKDILTYDIKSDSGTKYGVLIIGIDGSILDLQAKKIEKNSGLIVSSLETRKENSIASISKTTITLLIITAVIIIGLVFYLFRVLIQTPIAKQIAVMRQLASNNTNLDIPFADRNDEMGKISQALLVFKENIQETERLRNEQILLEHKAEEEKKQSMLDLADSFESQLGDIIATVSMAAGEMEDSSRSMVSNVEDANNKTAIVSSLSKDMSNDVASVSKDTEQLSLSIREITVQVEKSLSVVREATQKAGQTSKTVESLVAAVGRIGEVISLISDITEKTNLLALNATIEAARAGDAGKGFAVVASEVKLLSGQTAQATSEIIHQITAIQTATRESEKVINEIIAIIKNIDGISSILASAVEEQSAVTKNISRSVQQASEKTNNVSQNILEIAQTSSETGKLADIVLESSAGLTEQAETLNNSINKFLQTLRAN